MNLASTLSALARVMLAGGVLALAASTALPAMAQQAGGSIVVAESSNPPSLDAMATSSAASRDINMNVYETLYGFNEKQVPIPILAETAKVSPDGMTYVFPLRHGVLFSVQAERTIRLLPPLIISDAEAADIVARVGAVLREDAADVRPRKTA